MNSLSKKEAEFYQRHLTLDGFGMQAQEKLKAASVLVVGAGGLGCPALQYLASAGVGRLGVVDDDSVEISNLQRQFLYSAEDVGEPKATVATVRLKKHNPNISFEPLCERLNEGNIRRIFEKYDLVVDGSDNFETRYLVNDACVILGKPLVFGAIFKFNGQISVFNYENGPTYRCLFPEPPGVEALPSCADAGVLGVLPGIIGSMQALEAIKIITGIGEALSGRVLIFDAMEQKFSQLQLTPVQENQEIRKLQSIKTDKNADCSRSSVVDEIKELSPVDLIEMRRSNPKIIVIDVRESWERELERIQPSNHIPLGSLNEASVEQALPGSHAEEIAVYCKAGVRSMDACRLLHDLGYKKIYNLNGGMIRWHAEGMPMDID